MNLLQILVMNDEEWMSVSEIKMWAHGPSGPVPQRLEALKDEGFVASRTEAGKMFYSITETGRARLKAARIGKISTSSDVLEAR